MMMSRMVSCPARLLNAGYMHLVPPVLQSPSLLHPCPSGASFSLCRFLDAGCVGRGPGRGALVFFLLAANAGLLLVDHVHFQYNGMLMGTAWGKLGARGGGWAGHGASGGPGGGTGHGMGQLCGGGLRAGATVGGAAGGGSALTNTARHAMWGQVCVGGLLLGAACGASVCIWGGGDSWGRS